MIYVLMLVWTTGYVVPLSAYPTLDACQAAAQDFADAHPEMPAMVHCVVVEGT